MELNTLRETVNTNGEYSCGDIGVSASEWLDLLKQPRARVSRGPYSAFYVNQIKRLMHISGTKV